MERKRLRLLLKAPAAFRKKAPAAFRKKNVGSLDTVPVPLAPHSQGVKTASECSIKVIHQPKICPILN